MDLLGSLIHVGSKRNGGVFPEAASTSSRSWEVPEEPHSGAIPPSVHGWEDPVAHRSPPPADGPSTDHESGNDSDLDEEEPTAAT